MSPRVLDAVGKADKAVQRQFVLAFANGQVNRQPGLRKRFSQNLIAALGQIVGIILGGYFSIVRKREADTGLGKGDPANDFGAMTIFGLFRFQRFPSCRCIGIQFVDFYPCSLCT